MSYNKFGNKPTIIDGHKFPSIAEGDYYLELKIRKRAKDIIGFELQPEFTLQPGFIINEKKIQPIKYRADFLIHHGGYNEVVDVKGFETKEFKIKWKMLLYMHRNSPDIHFTIEK